MGLQLVGDIPSVVSALGQVLTGELSEDLLSLWPSLQGELVDKGETFIQVKHYVSNGTL